MANVAGKVEVGGHFHIFIRKELLSLGEIVKWLQFSLCVDVLVSNPTLLGGKAKSTIGSQNVAQGS